ncbi:MAG TPA: hypothetical protein VNE42_02980 [Acidimicrobiales bacterium]|nr:hypothetical protein [Acidimicrobiales bacterium]
MDIYRRTFETSSFLDCAVYLSFFPHLLSGQIVRGSELLLQIKRLEERDPSSIDLPSAVSLIFGGLSKSGC